jgi:hypothetical protein
VNSQAWLHCAPSVVIMPPRWTAALNTHTPSLTVMDRTWKGKARKGRRLARRATDSGRYATDNGQHTRRARGDKSRLSNGACASRDAITYTHAHALARTHTQHAWAHAQTPTHARTHAIHTQARARTRTRTRRRSHAHTRCACIYMPWDSCSARARRLRRPHRLAPSAQMQEGLRPVPVQMWRPRCRPGGGTCDERSTPSAAKDVQISRWSKSGESTSITASGPCFGLYHTEAWPSHQGMVVRPRCCHPHRQRFEVSDRMRMW